MTSAAATAMFAALRDGLLSWLPVQVRWVPARAADPPRVCWPRPPVHDPRVELATGVLHALRDEAAARRIELLGADAEAGWMGGRHGKARLYLRLHVASAAAGAHVELLCLAAARAAPAVRRALDERRVHFEAHHVGDDVSLLVPPSI